MPSTPGDQELYNGRTFFARLVSWIRNDTVEARVLDLVFRLVLSFLLIAAIVIAWNFLKLIGLLGVLATILIGVLWWAHDLWKDYQKNQERLEELRQQDLKKTDNKTISK